MQDLLNARPGAKKGAEQKRIAVLILSVQCLDSLQCEISVDVFLNVDATVFFFCFKILILPVKIC